MRYYKPRLIPGELLPAPDRFHDQLGGLPWGIESESWPVCAVCGFFQDFVAQFAHDEDRLDLGEAERRLYIFQCGESHGENMRRLFAMPPSDERHHLMRDDLMARKTAVISVTEEFAGRRTPDAEIITLPEARVIEWLELDDGIPESAREMFLDVDAYMSRTHDTDRETKIGGVPGWLQMPEGPGPPWRFALQLDCFLYFDGEDVRPEDVDEHKLTHLEFSKEESRWIYQWANFGDTGRGFVFVNIAGNEPRAVFFTQTH